MRLIPTARAAATTKSPCTHAADPLEQALQAVVGRRAEVAVAPRERRRLGETRLVVHPDGTLAAQGGTAAPGCILGNVLTQRARDIFRSRAYRSSLDRDDAVRARHCTACRYRDTCDGRPLFAYPHDFAPGPCPIDSRLMGEIDPYLDRTTPTADRYCAAAVSMPSPRKPPDWRSHSLA